MRTHALVVDDERLFDAAALSAKHFVQVSVAGPDRESKHSEDVGRFGDLSEGARNARASQLSRPRGSESGEVKRNVRER